MTTGWQAPITTKTVSGKERLRRLNDSAYGYDELAEKNIKCPAELAILNESKRLGLYYPKTKYLVQIVGIKAYRVEFSTRAWISHLHRLIRETYSRPKFDQWLADHPGVEIAPHWPGYCSLDALRVYYSKNPYKSWLTEFT